MAIRLSASPRALRAVLLLGHSCSGKSPLGEAVARSLSGRERRFLHLDFGALLRAVGDGKVRAGFTRQQTGLVRAFLRGRLLDRRTFWVARRIVQWFLREHRARQGRDVLVLNGLPRHAGQARDMASLGIDVALVIHLDCPAAVAWQRKLTAESGLGFEDRRGRPDRARHVFIRRARSFRRLTLPLVRYYRGRGVTVMRVPVGVGTSPAVVLRRARRALAVL